MIYGAFLHQFFPSIIQKTPLFELCLVTHQTVLLSSVSEATMARGNCKFLLRLSTVGLRGKQNIFQMCDFLASGSSFKHK